MGRSRLLVERRAPKPAASTSQPLQAKRRATGASTAAPDLQAQLQHASRYGHSLGAMPIQADLVIGQPNDKYEQEADAVAASAVQRQPAATAAQTQPEPQTVQRQDAPPGLGDLGGLEKMGDPAELGAEQIGDLGTADPAGAGGAEGGSPGAEAAPAKGGEEEAAAGESLPEEMLPPEVKDQIEAAGAGGGDDPSGGVEAKIQRAMSSGGSPPTEEEQASLRDRLGILNPEVIVIHDDNEATELCDMLSARAFTTQNHIFFGAGERGDQELLFHEAVHTIQQGAVEAAPPEEEMPPEGSSELGDNVLTPTDEQGGGLTELVQTSPTPERDLVQRREKEEEAQPTEATPQPDAKEENAPAEEKTQEQKEEEAMAEGDQQKQAAVENQGAAAQEEAGVEEAAEGDLGDRAEPGEAEAQPAPPETSAEGEETVVDPEDIPAEADVSEFEDLYWENSKESEVPGWDQEVAFYDMFQGAKANPNDFDLGEFFDGTGFEGNIQDIADTQELDRDALIGQAFAVGLVEGLIEGAIQAAMQLAITGIMAAFPKLAPGLGAVLILAQLHNPKAIIEEFGKKFKESWDQISGIGKIFSGDAKGWEAAALFFEFILGLVMMVMTILQVIDLLLQLFGALFFVLAKILYAIPFGIGVPFAVPLETASVFLFNVSKVIGIINLVTTLTVVMPLRLVIMALRALDLKFSDATPEELLDKQKKLQGHVKNFTKEGISSATKLGIDAYKANNPHPDNGGKAKGKSLKEDYKGAFKSEKLNPVEVYKGEKGVLTSYNKAYDKEWNKQLDSQGWVSQSSTHAGMRGNYSGTGSLSNALYFKTGSAHKYINDYVKPASGATQSLYDNEGFIDPKDVQAAIETEKALRERIVAGADELPPPPYEVVNKVDSAVVALEGLQEAKLDLQGLRAANNYVRGEAQDSVVGQTAMKQVAEGDQEIAAQQQEDLAEKMDAQSEAGAGAGDLGRQQSAIGGSASGIGGMMKIVEPATATASDKGEEQGAEADNAADPAEAGGGVADTADALSQGAEAIGGQGVSLVEQWTAQSQAAQAEAASNESELASFAGVMESGIADSEAAIEGTEDNEAELQTAEDDLATTEAELLAQREEGLEEARAWVDEHEDAREAIFDDLVAIITGEETEEEEPGEGPTDEDKEDGDLSGEDFSGHKAEGADLSELTMRGTNFSGADLSGADFSNSDLTHADLSGADLSEANFTGATIRAADLTEADLKNANLSNADLTLADLTAADLRNANLDGAELEDAILEDVVGYAAP